MTKNEAVTAVLNRLRGALGTGENPDGSNHNFITEWYNANVDKIGNGPWCEMTATWAFWTSGAKAVKNGRAYTVYGANDGVHGYHGASWHPGTAGMQAGDQVYFDWNGSHDPNRVDHTGVCEKVNGDGTFYTLEGNTSNKLERKLRDSKYVAGYVRFDWSLLGASPAPASHKPAPAPQHKPDATVRSIQKELEVSQDGQWGPVTDGRALFMRTVARAHAGYPHHVPEHFDVRTAQRVINTPADGIWGPRSQSALVNWVKLFQHTLGVSVDGQWGPKTDTMFMSVRHKYLMR